MRAVNAGNTYHIYDNTVQLYNGLPAGAYKIEFSQMQGFSLSGHPAISIGEKVYGVHEVKVDKVIAAFKSMHRSLGVILSGDKGIGKSLFAKLLCAKAIQLGYPVIIVDCFYPGVGNFIDSIDQEAIVLFDEFDKTFKASKNDDRPDAQAALLSLFDGTSMHKKLFCVTCNDLIGLNDFLVNRPGRFHYHFRFEYPTKEEIETYMMDHLSEDKHGEISKVVDFARKVNLNYDCLRAISYELARCDTFEEAVSDLNIIKPDYGQHVKMFILFADGSRFSETNSLDLFSDEEHDLTFGDGSPACDDYLSIKFTAADAVYSEQYGGFFIPANRLEVKNESEVDDPESWVMKHHGDYVNAHKAEDVIGMVIRPSVSRKSIHYFNA